MFREPFEEPDAEPADAGLTVTLPADLDKLITHLYAMEKQYGIVITVVTRGDIEDAWQQDHLADDLDAPPFTDEMWDKYQDTWAWRKGLSEAMWDGVWDTISDGLRDVKDNLSETLDSK
jgi:hypothetical protein